MSPLCGYIFIGGLHIGESISAILYCLQIFANDNRDRFGRKAHVGLTYHVRYSNTPDLMDPNRTHVLAMQLTRVSEIINRPMDAQRTKAK